MRNLTYRDVPENHNKMWTKIEDDKLRDMFMNSRFVTRHKSGQDVFTYWTTEQLGNVFKRTPGAMLKRLRDVGCLERDGSAYYVKGTKQRYANAFNPYWR